MIPASARAATQPADHIESSSCDQRYAGSCALVQKGAITLERTTRKRAKSVGRHRDTRAVRPSAARRGGTLAVKTSGAGRVNGIVAPLAEKVRQIQSTCGGVRVISGVRHTVIAGTRRMSLHAQGKAVDVTGNFNCVYAQLAGWPGGYSTDARRMRHIHISYDSDHRREWGLRFAHGRSARAVRHRHASLRGGVTQAAQD